MRDPQSAEMDPAVSQSDRLAELRARGRTGLAPLWLETLAPEEALAELVGRRDELSLLQKARFLLDLGREEDAAQVLSRLGDLPPGLRRLRDEIRTAVAGEEGTAATGEESAGISSTTLAELHASQGNQDAAIAMYRELLERNPADEEARRRLQQLVEPGRDDSGEALRVWLARVRRWRQDHRV